MEGHESGIENPRSCRAISDFLLPNFEEREDLASNPQLVETVQFFDELFADLESRVPKFSIEENAFLNSREVQEDFGERLKKFMLYVEKQILSIERDVQAHMKVVFFTENWKENFRRACYQAFFVHYGTKRNGEMRDGDISDYVYHPVRASSNALIAKQRFFDEKALLATVLHDTREDYHKGLVGWVLDGQATSPREFLDAAAKSRVKMRGKGQDEKFALLSFIGKFEQPLNDKLAILGRRDADLSQLISILTKSNSDRNLSFLDMLQRALDGIGEIDQEDVEQIKKAFNIFVQVMMVKMADRLDNVRSLSVDDTKGVDKQKHIFDETIFGFLAFADRFGMLNVFDWLCDYCFQKETLAERMEIGKTRRAQVVNVIPLLGEGAGVMMVQDAEMREAVQACFKKTMQETLAYCYGDQIPEWQAGRDYTLVFREVPRRFEDINKVRGMDQRTYQQGMMNYLLVYPTANLDVEEQKRIAIILNMAMREMFPDALFVVEDNYPGSVGGYIKSHITAPELQTRLGKFVIGPRTTDGVVNNNYNIKDPRFGVGEWVVFNTFREVVDKMFGPMIAAFFFDEEQDRDVLQNEIFPYMQRLRGDIDSLLALYREFKSPGTRENLITEQQEVKKDLLAAMGDTGERFERVFEILVRTILLKKYAQETVVKLNGQEISRVRLPQKCSKEVALCYAAPRYLGYRDLSFKVAKAVDKNDGNGVINLTLNMENAHFDQNYFDAQIATLREQTIDRYREEIGLEMPKVDGVPDRI